MVGALMIGALYLGQYSLDGAIPDPVVNAPLIRNVVSPIDYDEDKIMKVLYGGPQVNFGRFGAIQAGSILPMTQSEYAGQRYNPLLAPLAPRIPRVKAVSGANIFLTAADYGIVIDDTGNNGDLITLPNFDGDPSGVGWYCTVVNHSVAPGLGTVTVIQTQSVVPVPFVDSTSLDPFVLPFDPIHVRTGAKTGGQASNITTLGPGSPGKFAVEPLVAGDLVFIPTQTNKAQNGIYKVPAVSAAISESMRAADFNTYANIQGRVVIVDHGDNDNFYHDGDVWIHLYQGGITVGVSNLDFGPIGDGNLPKRRNLSLNVNQMTFQWDGASWQTFVN